MSKRDKLIQKILKGDNVTYSDAKNILTELGYELDVTGSHHNFRKEGQPKTITLKKRTQLISYQIRLVQEVLKNHGY